MRPQVIFPSENADLDEALCPTRADEHARTRENAARTDGGLP
jgi:hypothetical protein